MEETTTTISAVKQELRLIDWAAQIEAQQASGLTVQKWCAENGINPKTYYYHLRKLREKCVASAPAIVPLGYSHREEWLANILTLGYVNGNTARTGS